MNNTHLVKEFAILTGIYLAGEMVTRIFGWTVPGSVVGMVMLALALCAGIIQLKDVEQAAALLLDNLALFFVPAGVGVMLYFNLVAGAIVPIIATTVISTVVVIAVTGKVVDYFMGKAK